MRATPFPTAGRSPRSSPRWAPATASGAKSSRSARRQDRERALSRVARARAVGAAALAGLDVDRLGVDALNRNRSGVRDHLLGRRQRALADVVGEDDAVRTVGRRALRRDARDAAAAVDL